MEKDKPFRFKQFTVRQTGCTMKVNTDGVLLGALAGTSSPETILDIGTGTGVIALMLAQRFQQTQIDAVEIEAETAQTAETNFTESQFRERLKVYASSFQDFSEQYPFKKYDLIVSNPPFFLHSLKNPDKQKVMARHACDNFFQDMTAFAAKHLNPEGTISLILPLPTAAAVIDEAATQGMYLHQQIEISSFADQEPHRLLITLGFDKQAVKNSSFVIYQVQNQYSEQYKTLLKDFLTIF